MSRVLCVRVESISNVHAVAEKAISRMFFRGEAKTMSEEYAQYPWLFKGAYAVYGGTTKLAGRPVEATARVEVEDIDFTNKRVKIHAHSSMFWKVLFGTKKLGEKEIAEWIKIGERVILSEEAILEGEYEGVVRVEGVGVRRCIIQHYSEGLSTTVVFWDKEFNWPLKYLLIFRVKSEASQTVLDDLKDVLKGMLGLPIEDSLKKSKSKALKERSLILYLKETNMPGLIVNKT